MGRVCSMLRSVEGHPKVESRDALRYDAIDKEEVKIFR
jgi:hypothetical protein